MKFFVFHLMPYRDLEPSYSGPAWVDVPNRLYDPRLGHRYYNEYIDQLLEAERLGFDGVCVNEHHQNAYGNMPSPNLVASILARQTERVKIAVVGNALPLYNPPTRVAEEFAMIDVISGGRLIAGMVVGGGPEYYSFGINPTYARELFYEYHDLILEAWTTEGPFGFEGKHIRLRKVNPWPKPLQKPHPPVWIPGAGSLETMEFVAKRRYAYMGIPYFHIDVFRRNFSFFREACEREGYRPDPEQAGWLVPIYVGESDEKAREEFEPHLWYFVKRLLPGITIVPPGYTSERSWLAILENVGTFMESAESWEDIEKGEYAIVGSAETVYEKLSSYIRELGVGVLLGLFQLGSMPHEQALENMRRFAEAVLPRLREEFAAWGGTGAQPMQDRPAGDSQVETSGTVVSEASREAAVAKKSWNVQRKGEGSALVYLHGFLGEGLGTPAIDRLAESGFEVIRPALPGFSGMSELEGIDDFEDLCFWLLDVLDEEGVRKPALVGTCFGGWLAAEFAVRHPHRVERLVLTDAPGIASQQAAPAEFFGAPFEKMAELLFYDQSQPFAQLLKAASVASSKQVRSGEAVLPFLRSLAATARFAWNPYFVDSKLESRLGRIACNTLVVWGAEDRFLPPAIGRRFAEAIPMADFALIEGCGHFPPLEKGEEWAEIVVAFLRS